ncbi:hypothetical protein CDL12_07179 [Handroanthus impetiginosus]|uniref:Uncharacterized protein n=1 Tax=Handroanthus impetiginosus TaxID=429701 RepID=A0A2G9HRH5_9LAMI|nr:hypothetical protein CDL12_07179 [Handroanthus impetiginosus]
MPKSNLRKWFLLTHFTPHRTSFLNFTFSSFIFYVFSYYFPFFLILSFLHSNIQRSNLRPNSIINTYDPAPPTKPFNLIYLCNC